MAPTRETKVCRREKTDRDFCDPDRTELRKTPHGPSGGRFERDGSGY
jgi:hypothetical protein